MEYDIFLKNCPSIDLHGETRDTARVIVNDFVLENKILGQKKIVIIHGIGTGILKKEVQEILRVNRDIESYYIDGFNPGVTIAILK